MFVIIPPVIFKLIRFVLNLFVGIVGIVGIMTGPFLLLLFFSSDYPLLDRCKSLNVAKRVYI